MNIKEEQINNNTIQIYLDGRFDANTYTGVEMFLREKMEKGFCNFILNMENVIFIASAGLRTVLVIARELRQKCSGDLRIACLQKNVSKVFEISGLDNVLQIFDNMESAALSFTEQPN